MRNIKVFITSPSDVQEERKIAEEVISDWSKRHSDKEDVRLEPVMWERIVFPKIGENIQEYINKTLNQCDLVIGIFGTRFGNDTGVQPGGATEEITQMLEAGKPVMLYFWDRSYVPFATESIDFAQKAQLARFRESISTKALVSSFSNPEEFRAQLTNDLEFLMKRWLEKDNTEELIKALTKSFTSNPLELVIDPGTASPEDIGELLYEISQLYRMIGGSGIVFRSSEVEIHQGEALS